MFQKFIAACFAFLVMTTLQTVRAQNVEYVLKSPKDILSVSAFSEGLANTDTYKYDHGYIDTSGAFVIQPQFDAAGAFHDGRAWVAREDTATYEKTYGFINKQGKVMIPYQFEEVQDFSSGLAAVRKDSMWFYINKKGTTVLDSSYVWKQAHQALSGREYDEVEPRQFHDGWLMINEGDNANFVDSSGHVLRPEQPFKWGYDFSDGVAVITLKATQKKAPKGQDPLSKIYQSLGGRSETVYEQAIIDTTGAIITHIDKDLQRVETFHNGLARFRKEGAHLQSDTWGFINKKGEVVIPATYAHQPLPFSDGLAYAQVDGEKSDNSDGYAAIMDTTGTVISNIPFKKGRYTMHDSKLAFHEDLWGVRLSDGQKDTYNWGFMDKHGNVVIPPIYNRITNFNNGRASVYYIDEDGKGHKDVIKNPLK